MDPVRQCLIKYKAILVQRKEDAEKMNYQPLIDLAKIELEFCIQTIIANDRETLERLEEAEIA